MAMPEHELALWEQEAQCEESTKQIKAFEASAFPQLESQFRDRIVERYERVLRESSNRLNPKMSSRQQETVWQENRRQLRALLGGR